MLKSKLCGMSGQSPTTEASSSSGCGPTYADFGFERNGDAFSASAMALWPINRFRLFARAGALWWDVDGYDLTFAGRRQYSNDGVDLVVGVGGEISVVGGLRMRLEWERLEIDGCECVWNGSASKSMATTPTRFRLEPCGSSKDLITRVPMM
jgi:hypothetical protein